jgi:hypothetical protein
MRSFFLMKETNSSDNFLRKLSFFVMTFDIQQSWSIVPEGYHAIKSVTTSIEAYLSILYLNPSFIVLAAYPQAIGYS